MHSRVTVVTRPLGDWCEASWPERRWSCVELLELKGWVYGLADFYFIGVPDYFASGRRTCLG